MKEPTTRYIVEARFNISPSMFDNMGHIAESISSEELQAVGLSPNNQISFSSSDKKHTALLNFKSFAYFANYSVEEYNISKNDFLEKSEQFVLKAWPSIPNKRLNRLGVRSYFYTEANDFSILRDKYAANFTKMSKKEFEIFGKELSDLGLLFDFKNRDHKSHVSIGPMLKNQFIKNTTIDKAPEIGAFLDIDCFIDENVMFKKPRLLMSKVEQFLDYSQEINININKLLFEGD